MPDWSTQSRVDAWLKNKEKITSLKWTRRQLHAVTSHALHCLVGLHLATSYNTTVSLSAQLDIRKENDTHQHTKMYIHHLGCSQVFQGFSFSVTVLTPWLWQLHKTGDHLQRRWGLYSTWKRLLLKARLMGTVSPLHFDASCQVD